MTNSRLHDNILPIPTHIILYRVYQSTPVDCNEYNIYVNIMHNPGGLITADDIVCFFIPLSSLIII